MDLTYRGNKHIVPVVILVLASILVYSNTFKNPFTWDDENLILENKYVQNIKNIPLFFTAKYWRYMHPGIKDHYRPITVISVAIDYFIWKDNPFGYHLTNLLLHILNCILVYMLGLMLMRGHCEERSDEAIPNKRLLRGGLRQTLAMIVPFLAAILFATHPIHTESVTWIKNRFDLISLAFFLSSLLLFIRYTKEDKSNIVYLGALFSFFLVLLSKEMSITLPFILLIYVLYFIPKEERKETIKATIPFFGFAAFYIILKYTELLKTVSSSDSPGLMLFPHILLVFKTIACYIKLLILPVNLNAERMLEVPVSILEPTMLLSVSGIIVLIFIAIFTYNRLRIASFSVLWILCTLLPASNIIFLASRPIAEQRLYIPSAGFCLLLAFCLNLLYENKLQRIAVSLTALILIFYSYTTFMRNFDWRDPLTFWVKTAAASPRNFRVHNNLGSAYYNLGRYLDAIALYKKSIEINPGFAMAYNNLGAAYRNIGKNDEALEAFNKAIMLNPNDAEAYNNLAVALYEKSGLTDKAVKYFQRAIELKPDYAEVYNNFAAALYAEFGNVSMVKELYEKAMGYKPDYADPYYNLGLMYDAAKDYAEAVRYYEKAVQIKPDYAEAYNNLGAAYKDLSMYEDAIKNLKKAVELKPDYLIAHKNLARAYNDVKLYDQAKEEWMIVLRLKPTDAEAKKRLEELKGVK